LNISKSGNYTNLCIGSYQALKVQSEKQAIKALFAGIAARPEVTDGVKAILLSQGFR